jgi:hypothetical protein
LAWQSFEYLPHASHEDAIDGPLTVPQWSSAAPSAPAGATTDEHVPLVGTHTCAEAPVVVVTSLHDSSASHGLDVEHGVPQ